MPKQTYLGILDVRGSCTFGYLGRSGILFDSVSIELLCEMCAGQLFIGKGFAVVASSTCLPPWLALILAS